MRKLLALPLGLAIAASLMTSPAEAAGKGYSISASNRTYEYIKPGRYKYLSKTVMDVSRGHERDYLLLAGRVKRGPTKGRYVKIYATNTNDPEYRKNTYLGRIKLGSSGKFSKKIRPPHGGRWKYRVTIASSGRYKSASRTTTLDAFHWTFLHELTNLANVPGITEQRDGEREYVGPDVTSSSGRVYPGTRWGSQFAIEGGSLVTFKTRSYRCKKLTLKTGISDETPARARSGRIEFLQNSKVLVNLDMTWNQRPFDASGNDAAAVRFRNIISASHDVTVRVPTSGLAPEPTEESGEPAPEVRFIVGNAKAFCTFPSINKDL